MNELKAMPKGPNGGSAFALVRDKNGNPKADDISLIPKQVWDALSESDRDHLVKIHGPYNPKYL